MAAALTEGVTQRPLMGQIGAARTDRSLESDAVTAGLAYVSRCLRGHRAFGILTGSAAGLHALVERVAADCAARPDLHTVRIASPTDSVESLLASCLRQLGFELQNPGIDELQKLMIVFLRHESARGRRTVAIIEATDRCGPHVLEFFRTLAMVRGGATPAMTLILAGSAVLHRILDSPGMSVLRQFTRERFDLDLAVTWVTKPAMPAARVAPAPDSTGEQPLTRVSEQRCLIVMLDGKVIDRRPLLPGRLLIGRSSKNGLRLNSHYVSRQHAALVVTPDRVVVVDLRSTNATRINGEIAPRRQLSDGDLLAIGDFQLRYQDR